jgi:hypothetical protein
MFIGLGLLSDGRRHHAGVIATRCAAAKASLFATLRSQNGPRVSGFSGNPKFDPDLTEMPSS